MPVFIQSLEPRRLFSATPSQAVLDAMAKVQADQLLIKTDTAAFHAAMAATNAAFATAKAAALAAIKTSMGSGNPFGSFLGGLVNSVLSANRQVLKDAISAHTTELKANVAQWKVTHAADIQMLHTDIAALKAAKAAH